MGVQWSVFLSWLLRNHGLQKYEWREHAAIFLLPLHRKADPDSFWPLGCGDMSGPIRVLHRRRLLHRVRLQRRYSTSVVLERTTPHYRGQPKQQWVVTCCGTSVCECLLVSLSVCCVSVCALSVSHWTLVEKTAQLYRINLEVYGDVSVTVFSPPGDYPAPRAVLTGHDHEVVCVSVCAELGLVISGAKG